MPPRPIRTRTSPVTKKSTQQRNSQIIAYVPATPEKPATPMSEELGDIESEMTEVPMNDQGLLEAVDVEIGMPKSGHTKSQLQPGVVYLFIPLSVWRRANDLTRSVLPSYLMRNLISSTPAIRSNL